MSATLSEWSVVIAERWGLAESRVARRLASDGVLMKAVGFRSRADRIEAGLGWSGSLMMFGC